MGMYDTVLIRCPNCNSAIEEQSKAGECTLQWLSEESVPTDIADDIIGSTIECGGCGTVVTIVEKVPEPVETKVLMAIEII